MFWRTDAYISGGPKSGPIDKALGREADPEGGKIYDNGSAWAGAKENATVRAIRSIHSTQHNQVNTVWTTIATGAENDYVCYTRSSLIKSRVGR